jgi:hypothetical protein
VTARRLAPLLACLAALPQLVTYAGHVRSGRYPGSAYKPRVDAMLEAAQAAAEGGPFVAVRQGGDFSLAPGLLNDLGVAAILDLGSRLTGRALGPRALGTVHFLFLAAALFGLVTALDGRLHLALVPLFLLVPLSVREYRSVDSVAIHGALCALGIVIAAALGRPWPAWTGIPLGVALFVVDKARSVYGIYALAAGLALVTVLWRLDRRVLARTGCLLLTFALLQIPWHLAMNARASDPRVVDGQTLRSHGFWEPFVSGIGWTQNHWGIKPWDPWVAQFLADRLALEPVPIPTDEGERRSRTVYFSLWREAPLHLAWLYVARIPAACREHVALGIPGALAWLGVSSAALLRAWRRRDGGQLSALVPGLVLAVCLLFQTVVIDPRLIYANPLRFVSAYGLAVGAWSLLIARRPPEGSPRVISKP